MLEDMKDSEIKKESCFFFLKKGGAFILLENN